MRALPKPDGRTKPFLFSQWLGGYIQPSIPEWYQKITMWLVASVIGVKKIGDYGPALIAGIKAAVKK